MDGNKPDPTSHESDTVPHEDPTTAIADMDGARQTEHATQPVPNSPVKVISIRSKPESSDKTSSEASNPCLPVGWDPACISPNRALRTRRRGRLTRFGALKYPEYDHAFVPPRVSRAPPANNNNNDNAPKQPPRPIDVNDYLYPEQGRPYNVHFQPCGPFPRCFPYVAPPDLPPTYGELSLHAGEEATRVSGYPISSAVERPNGNLGGPSRNAEEKAKDSSLKGKSVQSAGKTETKASAENKRENAAAKEKKRPVIVSSTKEGEKTSSISTPNSDDDSSWEQKEKEEREDEKEDKGAMMFLADTGTGSTNLC